MSLLMRSKQSQEVTSTLDRIKENIREEQRSMSECEYLVCRKILKPLQAAKIIKEAYPQVGRA